MRVHVNAATSADGKLASRRREQLVLSGPEDLERVDRLRADSDAVLVGVGTVLADDPRLTVKDVDLVAAREERAEPPQPAPVVADSRARTPPDAALLDGDGQPFVLASRAAPDERLAALERAGAAVIVAGEVRTDLAAALAALEEHGIERLLVEGGGSLCYSLVSADLVDAITVYVAPTIVGGRDAPTLVDGDGFVEGYPSLSLDGVDRLGDGALLRWSRPAAG